MDAMTKAATAGFTLPIATLNVGFEGEEQAVPEAGQTVSIEVEARIDRIDGENVVLTPVAANGQPIEGPKPQTEEEEETSLRAALGDEEMGY